MNSELERIFHVIIVAQQRRYPGISLEGLDKTKNNLGQDNREPG
jgi:hypothetical protein